MRTLITGVPGWLGNRLLGLLTMPDEETSGYSKVKVHERKVRCLVFKDATHQKVIQGNQNNLEIVEGDILDKHSLATSVKDVDTIFHCVGLIHPRKIKELYRINVNGTENMLRAAMEAGVKRFIYLSSNSVAGCNRERDLLMTEKDPYNPYKHYGISKMQAEQLVNKYYREGKIETVIIRPCWYYGPGQPARQTRFFKMIKNGNPIIFGDGHNLRSMSYIDNVIQGLLLAESSEIANGQTYWIADKRPYETIEIYQTIAEILNVELKPRYIPRISSWLCEKIDDCLQAAGFYSTDFHVAGEMNKNIACSIGKAQKDLGYNPKIELKEGMGRSVEWCQRNGIDI